MIGLLTRRLISRSAGILRGSPARTMTNIPTEMPKNGNPAMFLIASLAMFVVCTSFVQVNGLITWGRAPDMEAALKKD